MKHGSDSATYLIVYSGKDRPWADWIADQLTRGGLLCEQLDVERQLPPSIQSQRIILVDSIEARNLAGRIGEVHLIIGVQGTPPISVAKGRTVGLRWDVHLEGRTEADASRQLWMAIGRRFGVSPPRSHDAARSESSGVPFPAPVTIFISYRRVDNARGVVTRLHTSLKARLPEARVFLDVADPDPESDVAKRLNGALSLSPILLAVVGADWCGNRVGRQPRIFDTGDFVRYEVANAGQRWPRVRVVVVLLDGANLPPAGELPEDIQYIASVPSERLDLTDFDRAVARIAEIIERLETQHSRVSDHSLQSEHYSVRPFSRQSD